MIGPDDTQLTLLQISDLHFGPPYIEKIGEAALRIAPELKPDAVIVSGDLTQRAKREQFEAAKEFMSRLPDVPRLVIPGNHDVPLYRFYERMFNFRQIRYFDIAGKLTGLHSRAMTSPDGKIRIPINEDAGEQGQIEEYLQQYGGEGIQHIALGSTDLYASIETLLERGVEFMPAPNPVYYSRIDRRLPGHGEDLDRLARTGALIDGEGVVEGGFTKVLLQRFGKTAIGPIFFEFIQRKGDDGFGEGNFKALFESIEEDQIRRGVLKPESAS